MTGVQTNYAQGNGATLEFGKITYHIFNASQLVKSGTYNHKGYKPDKSANL